MVRACPVAGKLKSVNLCYAFADAAPKSAPGRVFYGVDASNWDEWRKALKSGEPWYYIDNSYFDCVRGMQFRITRNRVQIDPEFRTSDCARFDALGVAITPMHLAADRIGYVLAVEQSPDFMRRIANSSNWLINEVAQAREHALQIKLRPWERDKIKAQSSLFMDLQGATYVLTHTSSAAVEALLAGIQVFTSPMSAVKNVAPEDRHRIFGVLADNQFTFNEIKSGRAWQWLAKQ